MLTELGLGLYTALFPNAQKEGNVEEKQSSGTGGAPQAAPKPSALEPQDTDSGEEESSPTAASELEHNRKLLRICRLRGLTHSWAVYHLTATLATALLTSVPQGETAQATGQPAHRIGS